jgi:hypothetical protein
VNSSLAIVFLSSLVATFNPSLLAAVSVMLLLPHPERLMTGYLLGAYTASAASGIAIVLFLHGSGALSTSRHTLSPGVDLAASALILAVAIVLVTGRDAPLREWRARRRKAEVTEGHAKQAWQQRLLGKGSAVITFAVGAAVSFPGVTYVNALDHIVKLNPSIPLILLLVGYFCLMQQILLEVPPLAYRFAPQQTETSVTRFRAWVERSARDDRPGGARHIPPRARLDHGELT